MTQNIFRGLGIALVTPFKTDGSVDYEALARLVDYQLDNGADFLCILATTGETPCLTKEEKGRIKKQIVEQVNGRVPILMGCGGNYTAAVVEELKNGDFLGIDGVLSVCPYYNKPSQEGLYRHFKAIAEATSLPVASSMVMSSFDLMPRHPSPVAMTLRVPFPESRILSFAQMVAALLLAVSLQAAMQSVFSVPLATATSPSSCF